MSNVKGKMQKARLRHQLRRGEAKLQLKNFKLTHAPEVLIL